MEWSYKIRVWSLQPPNIYHALPHQKFKTPLWFPPDQGFVKPNFDGANKGNPETTIFGVFRDFSRIILHIFTGPFEKDSNNTVELHVMIQGIVIDSKEGYFKLIVEGDSHIMIHTLQHIVNYPKISPLVGDWQPKSSEWKKPFTLQRSLFCTMSGVMLTS